MRLKRNYKPYILPEAKNDMRFAALWYNKQAKGLGKKFIKRIKEKVQSIQPNPFVCQLRHKDVRTAIVEQFPYVIHYIVNDSDKIIFIIAVLHTKQSPLVMNKRIE